MNKTHNELKLKNVKKCVEICYTILKNQIDMKIFKRIVTCIDKKNYYLNLNSENQLLSKNKTEIVGRLKNKKIYRFDYKLYINSVILNFSFFRIFDI